MQQCMGFDILQNENVIGLKGISNFFVLLSNQVKTVVLFIKTYFVFTFSNFPRFCPRLMFRIWWMIAFALSVACCAYGIRAIWLKWHLRPVIVCFDDKTTSIETISFPAITICSTQKYVIGEVDIEQIMETFIAMGSNQTAYTSLSPEMSEYFV